MRVIAITNEKGGVGKSTLATNLPPSLAATGARVLVVDTDPQRTITIAMLGTAPPTKSLSDILSDTSVDLETIIQRAPHHDCDIIPAAPESLRIMAELVCADPLRAPLALLGPLARLEHAYDYVIIDTAPTIRGLTPSACLAAHILLVPVDSGAEAYDAFAQVQPHYERLRTLNPNLSQIGVVFTRYNGLIGAHRGRLEDAQGNSTISWTHTVRTTSAFSNAYERGIPLNKLRKSKAIAGALADIAALAEKVR